MRLTSTIMGAGFLVLGMTALATPSLAQTGAPPDSGTDRSPVADDYPGGLAPGAVIPPYLASPPYIGPGAFITLPGETTGFSIGTLPGETTGFSIGAMPRRQSSTDEE